MANPVMLMFDEPSLGLAPIVVIVVMELIRDLLNSEEIRKAYLGI